MNRNVLTATVAGLIREQFLHKKSAVVHVISNSMNPLIHSEDQIIVNFAAFDKLQAGEIILYENEVSYCVHRYVGQHSNGADTMIITKGDNLKHFDPPFPATKILGKVTCISTQNRMIDLRCFVSRAIHNILGALLNFQWRVINKVNHHSLICKIQRALMNHCFYVLNYSLSWIHRNLKVINIYGVKQRTKVDSTVCKYKTNRCNY